VVIIADTIIIIIIIIIIKTHSRGFVANNTNVKWQTRNEHPIQKEVKLTCSYLRYIPETSLWKRF
jgi:hypothetical protein